jgi:hypothetical protein
LGIELVVVPTMIVLATTSDVRPVVESFPALLVDRIFPPWVDHTFFAADDVATESAATLA